jgi:hypothetical protein
MTGSMMQRWGRRGTLRWLQMPVIMPVNGKKDDERARDSALDDSDHDVNGRRISYLPRFSTQSDFYPRSTVRPLVDLNSHREPNESRKVLRVLRPCSRLLVSYSMAGLRVLLLVDVSMSSGDCLALSLESRRHPSTRTPPPPSFLPPGCLPSYDGPRTRAHTMPSPCTVTNPSLVEDAALLTSSMVPGTRFTCCRSRSDRCSRMLSRSSERSRAFILPFSSLFKLEFSICNVCTYLASFASCSVRSRMS